MLSVPKTFLIALLATAAVVGIIAGNEHFKNRLVPPPPRQTVESLHGLGIFSNDYDGWLAHVEAEIAPANPAPFGDGSSCYLCFPVSVDIHAGEPESFVNGVKMSGADLVALIKIKAEPGCAILIRSPMSSSVSQMESVAKSLVDAGFGDRVHPVLVGNHFSRVYSLKLAGRFLRVVVNERPRVASLHQVNALPSDYDGWLAHVEAELQAEGDEPPPDPAFPPGIIRTPFIVDIDESGAVFVSATAFDLPKFVALLKRVFDGQTEPDPILFRAALSTPIVDVEKVASAIVAAGFGGNTRPILDGEKFERVYSIKLGGRFMRVAVYGSRPEPARTLRR